MSPRSRSLRWATAVLAGAAFPALAAAEIVLSDSYVPRQNLEPGHYACRDSDFEFTSQFDILESGRYSYRGSERQEGSFSFDPASGAIAWTSGPFAAAPEETDEISGRSATRRSDGTPVIVLRFESPDYGISYEHCARLEN